MNYFTPFGRTEREDGYIIVRLARNPVTLPPVPLELQSFLTPLEWDRRLVAICELATRYTRPMLEKVWIIVGLIVTLSVPIVLYRALIDAIFHSLTSRLGDADSKLAEARLITTGVFVAILLIVWGPYILWRTIARLRMRALLTEWGKVDILAKNKGLFVPLWTVKLPNSPIGRITVVVTTPQRASPSVFHPDAYLPPYIPPPPQYPGYTGYAGAFQDVKI